VENQFATPRNEEFRDAITFADIDFFIKATFLFNIENLNMLFGLDIISILPEIYLVFFIFFGVESHYKE